MRVLIVYAHPSQDSFVGALNKTVCGSLLARGHEVDNLDLYDEGFDPVMSHHMFKNYLDTTQNRAEVEGYVDRLQKADALALVYPVWHDGLPAIMKGFIDRVFLPGVVFEIGADGVFRPLLQNIRRLAAVCTYGAHRSRISRVGDLPRRMVIRNLGTLIAPGGPNPVYRRLRDGRRHARAPDPVRQKGRKGLPGLVKPGRSRRRHGAAVAGRAMQVGGDQQRHVGRFADQLMDIVFHQAVRVGHPLAEMLGLEPGFDQEGLQEQALFRHILENAPGVGAVALALMADLLDRRQKRRRILAGDPIFAPSPAPDRFRPRRCLASIGARQCIEGDMSTPSAVCSFHRQVSGIATSAPAAATKCAAGNPPSRGDMPPDELPSVTDPKITVRKIARPRPRTQSGRAIWAET